jgi:circadian clock protein KaiC
LEKSPTGIRGFDELTGGGLPRGRPTLVCGGPGCGKTLFALEFLVRGAVEHREPGVFVSFEERPEDLQRNVASLGFDLAALSAEKRLVVDHVRVERSEIEETGDYDLEGLFIRLGYAIDSIGARRVVLDTIESLFSGLGNMTILRAEIRRLFNWLKDRGVTAVITGERGEGALTRQGLEEYVSDCVILLDNRVAGEITTRRLRIVKYRGSTHEMNECPFLIEDAGFSIMPITSAGLNHTVSNERVTSGIERLDTMLGGEGYYRGSSILVSGGAGTGKSTIAAHFAGATCRRGERCLYFAFEESESQILRNMRSVGLDLTPFVKRGLLQFHAARPTFYGLEMHLAVIHRLVLQFDPSVVIVDPMTNLMQVAASARETRSMLIRLIDFLKTRGTTALFTSLTSAGSASETSDSEVSSLTDTWLLVRNIEAGGERNRALYILKSRGMAHSNQVREFILSSDGVKLVDVYTGPGGVLTGSARVNQEAADASVDAAQLDEFDERERGALRRRAALEAQIAALRVEIDDAESALKRARALELTRQKKARAVQKELATRRGSDGGERTPARTRKRNGSEERT